MNEIRNGGTKTDPAASTNIVEMIDALSSVEFDSWTDIRMVGRGYGMVDRVSKVVASSECVSANVRGSAHYVTSVFSGEDGKIDSRCTCPVRNRCKHAVALMLKVQRMQMSGETIPTGEIPVEMDARLLVRAAEEAKKREEEEKRLAALREEEKRESERRAEIEKIKANFEQIREKVLVACSRRDAPAICEAVEDFLVWSDDDEDALNYPGEFQYVPKIVDWTMETVVVSLRESGWNAADVLAWACDLTRPYHFFNPGKVVEQLWESPTGEYAGVAVWAQVAERLEAKLASLSSDECGGRDSQWNHLLESLRTVWLRAGHEEMCLRSFVEYAGKAKNWVPAMRLLNRFGRYDEAIRIGREGIKDCLERGEIECEDENGDFLMDPLADAFAGNGEYAKAAAVRAELFLSSGGIYSSALTVERFHAILADAEKIGLRETVRAALVHVLETGWNPSSIVTWRSEKSEVSSCESESPSSEWPLPWANEGVRLFDCRWDEHLHDCQVDRVFLLRLALVEGDKDEIARRFCDLPEFPWGEWASELLERVKDAMKGVRPDIVEVIILHGKGMSELRRCGSEGAVKGLP